MIKTLYKKFIKILHKKSKLIRFLYATIQIKLLGSSKFKLVKTWLPTSIISILVVRPINKRQIEYRYKPEINDVYHDALVALQNEIIARLQNTVRWMQHYNPSRRGISPHLWREFQELDYWNNSYASIVEGKLNEFDRFFILYKINVKISEHLQNIVKNLECADDWYQSSSAYNEFLQTALTDLNSWADKQALSELCDIWSYYRGTSVDDQLPINIREITKIADIPESVSSSWYNWLLSWYDWLLLQYNLISTEIINNVNTIMVICTISFITLLVFKLIRFLLTWRSNQKKNTNSKKLLHKKQLHKRLLYRRVVHK